MGIHQANQVLSVPSGPLEIPALEAFNSTFTDAGTPPIYFSLVIPTYNESKNVKSIVEKLSHLLDGSIPGNYELIVVDDNSPDRTWEVAQSLTAEYPELRGRRRGGERGRSQAGR